MSIDIHALSGAYAVDALDDIERAQFERHLAECLTCRTEVDSLREAAALLPETTDVTPPDSLRESVLAGIATVRPLPPIVLAAGDRGRSTRRRFPQLVAAAVALIALGGAGAAVWQPWADDATPSVPVAGPSVEEAPDAETFTYDIDDGGTMTVVRSKSLNQAVVSTAGLPTLPDGQTYELWLIHGNHYVRAGLMDGDVSSVLLKGDPAAANGIGVTVEPDGGSDLPSLSSVVIAEPFKQA